jgi:hypothetical protein
MPSAAYLVRRTHRAQVCTNERRRRKKEKKVSQIEKIQHCRAQCIIFYTRALQVLFVQAVDASSVASAVCASS